MKSSRLYKILVDCFMTLVLLLLMAYELIGTLPHELLGTAMFLLFLIHHILNRTWIRTILKGRYPPFRIVQTALVLLILGTMFGSMASGVVLSKHIFSALPLRGGRSAARTIHMLCGYWNFVLMSLHLGLHWGVILNAVCRVRKGKAASPRAALALRGAAALLILYGVRSFFFHDLGNYLLLRTQFVFFDFDRSVALFLLDYLCVMSVFIFLGDSIGRFLRGKNRHSKP